MITHQRNHRDLTVFVLSLKHSQLTTFRGYFFRTSTVSKIAVISEIRDKASNHVEVLGFIAFIQEEPQAYRMWKNGNGWPKD